jgi:Lactonase, 7-bladed beta-propeller
MKTAACWIVNTNSGRYVYTTNTGSGSVSSYTLAEDGTLTLLDSVAASLGAMSPPIDMAFNNDSRHLYVHAAGSQTVEAFRSRPMEVSQRSTVPADCHSERRGCGTLVASWEKVMTTVMSRVRKYFVMPLVLQLLGTSIMSAPRALRITQLYATSDTANSATVVWNTNVAADSLLQYSTVNPVPAGATQIYSANQLTVHEIPLAGLTPATVYFYKVTSCVRKGCVTAGGSFETSPSCPDVVPPVSGSWQRDVSPNVSGATALTNQLLGVAAISDNDVWAVGWAQDPNGPQYIKRPLVEHFDGRTWSIVPGPNRSNTTVTQLYSVAAASAKDVWAVGSSSDGNLPSLTLIQRWDGTQWKIIPSPSPDEQFNELRGVEVISANDAWAVGYRGGTKNDTPIETLILHWDGAAWTQISSPNVSGGANQLFGVTAISASDVWAVGSVSGAPLALHWNGSAWSVASVGVGSGLSSESFAAVTGSATNDVWAVGQGNGIFTNQVFATIRHWDGTRWTEKLCRAVSASNSPPGYEGGGPNAYFTGVSAVSGNDVWAVGVLGSGPMILHWDGQAWTEVTHPRAFPNAASLLGVTTSAQGSAWAVGFEIEVSSSGSVTPAQTLIDQYVP